MDEQVQDVLIIGAGLSGIGMACHLRKQLPELSFRIIERRQRIGGTWDLFRYPGIRSDSDMFTFGYAFRPWTDAQVLADGDAIRRYISDTAEACEVTGLIDFGWKCERAAWSSQTQNWQVDLLDEASGQRRQMQARFVIFATGYYDYDAGYTPEYPGRECFTGTFVHPQHWPGDLDYRGKRIIVIGSGATAVTLVPALAEQAAQVTMLQRSPTYIFSLPALDRVSQSLKRVLPERWVFTMTRWRNIVLQRAVYKASRRWPQRMRRFFLNGVKHQLGVGEVPRDFSPDYAPWDQRLCAVPDGDLFRAIKSGRASVITDEIECFTEQGLRLKSGPELQADIIVSATGLRLQMLGGVPVEVDGMLRRPDAVMTYKAVLLEDTPNLGVIFGYTNATWTLKADIAAQYLCRLLKHMRAHRHAVVKPRAPAGQRTGHSVMDALNSGYVQRADKALPRQGAELPWRVLNDYPRDRKMLLREPVEDGVLQFLPARQVQAPDEKASRAA